MSFFKKLLGKKVLHEGEDIIEGIFLNYSIIINDSLIFYL
jgi:hypothetical protein